ncbi:hypothetical protein EWM60_05720 [Candidatus Erwinia dacicola]|nr:hypothetical protein [Candidatus Erwinia dacicola]
MRPYHSWERRLNEHTNGLIRHFHPKATDFSQVSHRKIAELKHTLNTRGQNLWAIVSQEVFLTHLLAHKPPRFVAFHGNGASTFEIVVHGIFL